MIVLEVHNSTVPNHCWRIWTGGVGEYFNCDTYNLKEDQAPRASATEEMESKSERYGLLRRGVLMLFSQS